MTATAAALRTGRAASRWPSARISSTMVTSFRIFMGDLPPTPSVDGPRPLAPSPIVRRPSAFGWGEGGRRSGPGQPRDPRSRRAPVPPALVGAERHRHRLDPPDLARVLVDGPIARERPHARDAPDRHTGPVVRAEVNGPGPRLGVHVRREVGAVEVAVAAEH